MKTGLYKKLLSGLLCLALLCNLGLTPALASATEGGEGDSSAVAATVVTGFAALAENVQQQTVATGTELSALNLPDTLNADLPEIGVMVGPAQTMAVGDPINITGMSDVEAIQTAIEAALAVEGVTEVVVTGSFTTNSGLMLYIPAGKKVNWKADYTKTGGGMAIQLSVGTFEVSDGTIFGDNSGAINAAGNVTVSGDGHVRTTGDNYDAIYVRSADTTVTVSGNAKVETAGGNAGAIRFVTEVTGNTVEISGGTVCSALASAIWASNDINVNMMGGTVSSTVACAIRAGGDLNVEISGGVVASTAGDAIEGAQSVTATMSGGVIYGASNAIYNLTDNIMTNITGGLIFGEMPDTGDGWKAHGTGGTIPIDVVIPQGKSFTIPEAAAVTIPEGVTLTNNGTILQYGTLACLGTINGTGTIVKNAESAEITVVDAQGTTLDDVAAGDTVKLKLTLEKPKTRAAIPNNQVVFYRGTRLEDAVQIGAAVQLTDNGTTLTAEVDYKIPSDAALGVIDFIAQYGRSNPGSDGVSLFEGTATGSINVAPMASMGEAKFANINDAILAANAAGGTIKLLRDSTYESTTDPITGSVALDLAGQSLTLIVDPITIYGENAHLTIEDSGTGGKIIQKQELGMAVLVESGALTVKSGSIESEGTTVSVEGGSATIEGGSIRTTGDRAMEISGGSATIRAGSFEATDDSFAAVAIGGGSLTIEGGSFKGPWNSLRVTGGTVALTGGTFHMVNGASILASESTVDTLLAPGYVYYEGESVGGNVVKGDVENLQKTVTVGKCAHDWGAWTESGGVYTRTCQNGCKTADGAVTTQTAAVMVENGVSTNYYPDFLSAAGAASNGATMTLLADITEEATLSGRTFTLNLNGKTMTKKVNVTGGRVIVKGSGTMAELALTESTDVSLEGGTYTKLTTAGTNTLGLSLANYRAFFSDSANTWVENREVKLLENVTVKPAPFKITTHPSNVSVTYGYTEAPTLTVVAETVGGDTSTPITYQWYEASDNILEQGATAGTFALPIGKDAGNYAYYCVLTRDGYSNQCVYATIEVKQAVASIENKDYATNYTYTASAIPAPQAANFTTNSAGAMSFEWFKDSVSVGTTQPKDAGTYQLVVKTANTTNVAAGSQTFDVTITPKAITPTIESDDLVYTGRPDNPDVTVKDGTTTLTALDYIVITPIAYHEHPDVGTYSATIILQGNYSGEASAPFNVVQAAPPTPKDGAMQVTNNRAFTYSFDLAQLLTDGKTFGSPVTYTVSGSSTYYDELTAANVVNGKLSLPVKAVDADAEGEVGTITVTVSSRNYKDMTATITVSAVNKTVPRVTIDGSYDYTYGQALSEKPLRGTVTDGNGTVAGTLAWTTPTEKPIVGTTSAGWTFTPTDTTVYAVVTGTQTITVAKATPTGTPAYTPITQAGKTLADANLTKGTITLEGDIGWWENGNTVVEQGKSYEWLFVPTSANLANYNGLSGTIIPWPNSSTGGGGGTVTPPKPTEPEISTGGGSTTATVETETKTTGNTTSATVSNDSVKKAIEAAEKAAATGGTTPAIEIKAEVPAGATQLVVTLPKAALDSFSSSKTETMTITSGLGEITLTGGTAASIAKQAGSGDIKVTLGKVDTEKGLTEAQRTAVGDAPVYDISITAGGKHISAFDGGTVTVALPYTLKPGEDPTGVVVWYVDAEGKLQKVASTYDEKTKTVTFTTNHLSLYAVGYDPAAVWVNPFTDVAQGAWYYDAVKHVNQNGLMSGTSATTFSPDVSMTRGMFVTVLYRLAGIPQAGEGAAFTDVAATAYYAQAVAWASQNGIVNGIGGGKFAPDHSISREQMAVIMANYAKAMGLTLPQTLAEITFADSTSISPYATDAVRQMQQAGILSGKGGNQFDPQGTATRAEVATVLKRFATLTEGTNT